MRKGLLRGEERVIEREGGGEGGREREREGERDYINITSKCTYI